MTENNKASSSTETIKRINALKKTRKAIILAHNYQPSDVQDIADFVGDSLELAQLASKTPAKVLVFAGVHFMAETAYILAPNKTVLIPDVNAGCPMADMITADALRAKKAALPHAAVVCYVNSTAAVKAESHICCTSSNAVQVVQSLSENEIVFVPDRFLGLWVATQVEKNLHLWEGYCPTHANVLAQHVINMKSKYPDAKVIVHPECRPEVDALADAIPSTSGMLRYVKQTNTRQFIVGTEIGILHRMRKENPEKEFIPLVPQILCPTMKLTTLDKIADCLEQMHPQVTVPEEIRLRAFKSVDLMIKAT